ncbi:MAG: hypothetical protein IT320_10510 [Anaerolineae bacterium]|nr:hypothetical protein [Anaerolineae bacterium]
MASVQFASRPFLLHESLMKLARLLLIGLVTSAIFNYDDQNYRNLNMGKLVILTTPICFKTFKRTHLQRLDVASLHLGWRIPDDSRPPERA